MGQETRAPEDGEPRWPRRRTLDPRRRWDPDHPSEDVPTITSTVTLTAFGLVVVGVLAWLSPLAAVVVSGLLLVWSIGVEVTGNTVSRRVRWLPHRILWILLRPAYAVGLAVWAIVEAVFELFFG